MRLISETPAPAELCAEYNGGRPVTIRIFSVTGEGYLFRLDGLAVGGEFMGQVDCMFSSAEHAMNAALDPEFESFEWTAEELAPFA